MCPGAAYFLPRFVVRVRGSCSCPFQGEVGRSMRQPQVFDVVSLLHCFSTRPPSIMPPPQLEVQKKNIRITVGSAVARWLIAFLVQLITTMLLTLSWTVSTEPTRFSAVSPAQMRSRGTLTGHRRRGLGFLAPGRGGRRETCAQSTQVKGVQGQGKVPSLCCWLVGCAGSRNGSLLYRIPISKIRISSRCLTSASA